MQTDDVQRGGRSTTFGRCGLGHAAANDWLSIIERKLDEVPSWATVRIDTRARRALRCITPDEARRDPEVLRAALIRETGERRRAECLAKMQTDVVQLALDLLVREPDIEGFFGALTKTMVEEGESHACGVWLIDDDQQRCELWMAYVVDRLYTPHDAATGTRSAFPRESMAEPSLQLHTGLEPDRRIQRRRCAPARAGSGIQPSCRCAGRGHRAARARQPRRSAGSRSPVRTPPNAATEWWRVVLTRGDRASGGAGAAPEPPGGTEAAGRAPQGHPRGAQPARARHSRQSRAGVRRDPDAAAGRSARGRRAAAGRRGEARDRGRSRPHAPDRGAAIGRHAASQRRRRRGRRDGPQAARGSRAAHDQRADRRQSSTSCRASATAWNGRSSASRRRR